MDQQVTTSSLDDEEKNILHHRHRHDERDETNMTTDSRDDDELSEELEDLSLECLLQEKLERIAILERSNRIQGENLEILRNQLIENEVKHKEKVYWLELELDTKRRDNDACEERMAELYNDLRDMVHNSGQESNNSSIAESDKEKIRDAPAALVAELQTKVAHYERTLGIMDNQVGMVKTSCDAVVKTLKEEISDLMEERCKMEIDLLNKMASLEDEWRREQIDQDQLLKIKDETIHRLRNENSCESVKLSSHKADEDDGWSKKRSQVDPRVVSDLESEVSQLRLAKKKLEVILSQERSEAEETISRLEDSNMKLEQRLESTTDDLTVMKMSPDTEQASNALAWFTQEREAIVVTLDRVAAIWEGSDASIRGLENVMVELRPTVDGSELGNDRGQLLSTLEAACLLHGQVKVALLLIELKLRNHLSSLRKAKTSMLWAAPNDHEVAEQMRAIQTQTLQALNAVESNVSQGFQQLENRAINECTAMKASLRDREEALRTLQRDYSKLEEELVRYKSAQLPQESSPIDGREECPIPNDEGFQKLNPVPSMSEESTGVLAQPERTSLQSTVGISAHVIEKLQTEVMNVVERINTKNATIEALKQDLGESKAREQVLKKELKRIIRRQQKLHHIRKREHKGRGYGSKDKVDNTPLVESSYEVANEGALSLPASQAIPVDSKQTSVKRGPSMSNSSEIYPEDATASTKTLFAQKESTITQNIPPIARLQPSPREVNKGKNILAVTKASQDVNSNQG